MENGNDIKNRREVNDAIYRFDRFEFDPANRILLREGESVPLTGKVFDVLIVFVENPGRLLEKDELIDKVWPGEFVEEGNLARNVSTLRKALGDTGAEHKYIATVQGRGYRFVSDISQNSRNGHHPGTAMAMPGMIQQTQSAWHTKRLVVAIGALVIMVAVLWMGKTWLYPVTSVRINSLAILPLKPTDPSGNELGLGITDSIIRRLSSTGTIIVRPTSSVRQYLSRDVDALTAARELGADAVLEGTLQRDNDRLRISVNMLRTGDGASLWADNFDMNMADVFTIQDTVSQQIATRLRLQLDRDQTARLQKRTTSNAIAYEYYLKGVYSFDQRRVHSDPRPQIEAAIEFFKKAIEIDQNYALAYATLGYAYVWKAISIEPDPIWAKRAREMIDRAETIDPRLAEIHVARYLLLSSAYENWNIEGAIRELRIAQNFDPSVGHTELASSYFSIGLDEKGVIEVGKALDADPTSDNVKRQFLLNYWNVNKYDEWYNAKQTYFPNESLWPWYLVGKGRLDEAEKIFDQVLAEEPDPLFRSNRAMIYALRGNSRKAESEIPLTLREAPRQNGTYKNAAYNIACIYALNGKSGEAVKWLNEAAAVGLSSYPLFSRDPYLDRIRRSPEFVDFMSVMKTRYLRFVQDFG